MTTIDASFLTRVYELVGPDLAGLRTLVESKVLSQAEIDRVVWPYAAQLKKPSPFLKKEYYPFIHQTDSQRFDDCIGRWAADALIVYVSFVQRNPTPSFQVRRHRLVSGSARKRNHNMMTSALYSSCCKLKHNCNVMVKRD